MTKIETYTLENKELEVSFINIGGCITSFKRKDSHSIVLDYQNEEDYLPNNNYLNAIIGRTSNRIKEGKFTLDGIDYQLDLNTRFHHHHGGKFNLTHHVFDVSKIEHGYALTTTLPKIEGSYPGTLEVRVEYTLQEDTFHINYYVTTDETTIVNLTQHLYFNLHQDHNNDILDHTLWIPSHKVAQIDETGAFIGTCKDITNSVLDFSTTKEIGKDATKKDEWFSKTQSYDHCYVLSGTPSCILENNELSLAISTSYPSMQVYTSNHFNNTLTFKEQCVGKVFQAIAIEPSLVPYDFTSQRLEPGQEYHHTISYTLKKKSSL